MAGRNQEVQIILTFKDQATGQLVKVTNQINIFQRAVTGAGKNVGLATTGIAKSFRTLSRFLLGAAGIAVITRAVRNTIRAINDLADSAGELQGLERAFFGLSSAIGKSSDEMLGALEKASQGMISQRDLMKRWNLSVQLLGLQLGERMPEALEKLTLVSAATGESMDFLFDSLVRGVGRFQPRILDNLGVIIKLNETYDRFAAELGTTRDQMSTLQKQTAIFNDVMEQLDRNTQALPDLAGTLTLEFARFKATLQNTKDLIIRSVTPALGTLFQIFNELAARVIPTLVNVMTNFLGPALALAADAFRDIASTAADAGESMITQFGGRMRVMARNAFNWGLNIMIEFADGIIRGAVGVLTAAMNFVGNLLASWLSAGSPPKIAPNIDKWGAAALTEWLKGMENADFDVLEGVQRPLKDILNLLLSEELIDEATFNAIFKDVAFFMSKALSDFRRTGVLDTSIFDKLRAAGGAFGDELAELAKRQLKLAAATREVKLAEEALEKARAQTKESKNLVKKLAAEFNKLKKAGASKAILEAKRQEFLIAKKQWWLARGQIRQAEERIEAAEDAVDPLKDEVKLQERLLDQLIGLAQLQQKLLKQEEERATKAKKGKVPKGGGVEVPRPIIPRPDFSKLNAGLEEAKNNLRAKLLDLFAPLIKKWNEEWKPLLDKLAAKWEWFTGIVKEFWDRWVKPVLDDLKEFIPPELRDKLVNIAGKVIGVALAVGILGAALTLVTNPLTLFIAGAVLARMGWEKNWLGIQNIVRGSIMIIQGLIEGDMQKVFAGASEIVSPFEARMMEVWENIKASWIGTWELIKILAIHVWNTVVAFLIKKWEQLKAAVLEKGDAIRDSWIKVWESVKALASHVWNTIVAFLKGKWEGIKKTAAAMWELIKATIIVKLKALFKSMGLDLDKMVARWKKIWQDVKDIAKEVWRRITEAVSRKVEEVRAKVEAKVTEIKTKWNTLWTKIKAIVIKVWNETRDAIKERIEKIRSNIETKITAVQTKWDEIWGKIFGTAETTLDDTVTTVETKMGEVKSKIETAITAIKTFLTNQWESFKTLGGNLINAIKSGVLLAIGGLISSVTTAIENALKAAKKKLGIESPSSLFAEEIGKPIAQGIGMGIMGNAPTSQMGRLIDALLASGGQAGQTYNFNQTINTRATQANIMRDYEIARALAG